MLKSRLNFIIINFLIISITIYFVYQARDFWIMVVSILKEILLPFLMAFSIVYFLNPIVLKFVKKNIPYKLSVLIVLFLFLLFFVFLFCLVVPLLFEQFVQIIETFIELITEINNKTNIDFAFVLKRLTVSLDELILKFGSNISFGAFNFFMFSVSFFVKTLITVIVTVYLLFDFDNIKSKLKRNIKNKKIYDYFVLLNKSLNSYLSGFYKIIVISFFEYTIIYFIIGHPKALLLGLLAGILNVVPYFGAIITNLIAFLTAFCVSSGLIIKTIVVFVVFSIIDGYIINPLVYNKTMEIHPIIIIFWAIVGEKLFGVLGIIFSLPLAIIMLNTYLFFKKTSIN